MNKEKLLLMRNYDLEMKIQLTIKALNEYINYYGNEGVYLAFSGGKDSTVLLDILRNNFTEDIPAVFSNTKNEFTSIIEHVKYCQTKYKNINIVMSEKSIEDVVTEYGYPIISKQVSNTVYYARKNIEQGKNTLRVRQIRGQEHGSIFNKGKWEYLLDAPFKISDKCCNELKKKPLKAYEKRTNRKPIVATLSSESKNREHNYLKHGCNNFVSGVCTPLGFWTEHDILNYIKLNNIKIASVYGEVVEMIDGLQTTGEKRTGCVGCLLGMEYDKERIKRLKELDPKKWDYIVNKLEFRKVCEFLGYEVE